MVGPGNSLYPGRVVLWCWKAAEVIWLNLWRLSDSNYDLFMDE